VKQQTKIGLSLGGL